MPELPEVESLRRKLKPRLLGHKIESVTLRRRDLRFPVPLNLQERLSGLCVTDVRRRSKYLLIDFADRLTLIVHLGMSGRFFFTESGRPFDKHDHVLLDFDDGLHLRLRDPRRFGLLFLTEKNQLEAHKFFRHLGPEPLSKEFSADYLSDRCRRSRAPIKNLVMNAKHVVGVGNIYAAEALFLSKVRPTRQAYRLKRSEIEKLCDAIKQVLRRSIASGGTTFRDYVGVDEEPGLHQLNLNVYGREHQPCHACGALIQRVLQAGRSGFYCPQCQK